MRTMWKSFRKYVTIVLTLGIVERSSAQFMPSIASKKDRIFRMEYAAFHAIRTR